MNKKIILVGIFFILFFLFLIFEPVKLVKKGAFGSYSDSSLLNESFVLKYRNLSEAYILYYNYSITKNEKALEEAKRICNVTNIDDLNEYFNKLLEKENIKGNSIKISDENFSFIPIFLFTLISYLLFFVFERKVVILPIISFIIVFPFFIFIGVDEFSVLALSASFIFGFFKQEKNTKLLEFFAFAVFSIVFYLLGFKSFEFFAIFTISMLPKLFVEI
jgi:hypothetical protein